jgi:hypothetical protein
MQSLSSRAEEGRSGKKVEVRIKKFATANPTVGGEEGRTKD